MFWRLLSYQKYSAFENMAIDEAIFLETIRSRKPPTIRFYGWKPPAVSIGYFQEIKKEVNIEKCLAEGVDIVRRQSGGKAVFHNDEITYSIAASGEEKRFPSSTLGTYKVISECLASGLAYIGLKTTLDEKGRLLTEEDLKSCCFSTSSRHELLVSGRKICGSAQTRTSKGFLQHGSILKSFNAELSASFLLPPCAEVQLKKINCSVTAINSEVSLPQDELEICANLKKGFAEILDIEIEEGTLDEREEELKNRLLIKYSDWQWTRKGHKNYCRD